MPDTLSYDVIIIGGGPAGYNAAIRAGQLGLKVACVEKRKTYGGTCLNVGCIPSKALLHASELYEAAGKDFAGLGIKVTPELDLPTMHAQKAKSVDQLTKGVEFLFRKNKVDIVRGEGRIAGPGKVVVKGFDGVEETLEAKNIVIATGSEPSNVGGVAVDQARIVDSTGALALPNVPKSLIVIGAGIIGLELGSVWRRLGAAVTVVEFLDRIIPGADAEVATTFQRSLAKQGMTFKLGTKVTGAEVSGAGVKVMVEPVTGGAAETLEAEVVLVAVGRRPYTEGLGLETVGVAPDARGFIPNTHYQTTAPGVWVIGDVTYGPMLAHKAEDEAVAVIELIAGKAGHVNYDVIPSVIYTAPEVAWVGKDRGGAEGAGRGLQGRQVPVQRQQPRQGEPRGRGLREGAGRRRDRPHPGRSHDGPAGGRDGRRILRGHGVRRLQRGRGAHLPPPPHALGSAATGGHGGRGLDDAGLIDAR